MKLQEVLQKEMQMISPSEEEMMYLKRALHEIADALAQEIKHFKIKADIFVGGSLAKGTLIKREEYDIDIFVRFHEGKEISLLLGKVIERAVKHHHWKFQKLHGSRDYFRIFFRGIVFEIIPVLKIRNVKEAENITDLSYFHVFYIKKRIGQRRGLADQIRLAKQFCFAQGCYGAESYIQGFSGYALELLITYYGSFLRFLKKVVESEDKIILDPEHYYKSKLAILQEMNEAKLQSPLVVVDPVHKERNALAALSQETFERFRVACRKLLRKPSLKFFELRKIDPMELQREAKRRNRLFFAIEIATDRQEGDIAGTKLLKFSRFFAQQCERYFNILRKEFFYQGKSARFYLVLKRKKEILIQGPPVTSLEHLRRFKRLHPDAFVKKAKVYAHEKGMSVDQFFKSFVKKQRLVMRNMGITSLKRV